MRSIVVLGPPSEDLQEVIDRRRALGLDGHDEVWNGEYHMAPMARASHGIVQAQLLQIISPLVASPHVVLGPFNLGMSEQDFRVPDAGVLAESTDQVYVPTALLVIEVLSPDDETFEKFDFYAERGVGEVLVADPQQRSVSLYRLPGAHDERYSQVLNLWMGELHAAITWP